MAEKTPQSPFDPDADTRADYALIAAASGAAIFALIYLILICQARRGWQLRLSPRMGLPAGQKVQPQGKFRRESSISRDGGRKKPSSTRPASPSQFPMPIV